MRLNSPKNSFEIFLLGQILFACIVFTVLLAFSSHSSADESVEQNTYSLTNEELTIIDHLAESIPIEKAIAQLLIVGVPGDVFNYSKHPKLEELTQLGIGNFMANTYNYADSGRETVFREEQAESRRELIYNFHSFIRSRYKRNSPPIPPLIFADFENEQLTSFPDVLLQPPPALTLTATRDGDLVRTVGKYMGFQLKYIGIDGIWGPVLDIDGTLQGKLNSLVSERSFGGTPGLVVGSASHYINGLRTAGLLTFAKHFPGHGCIEESSQGRLLPAFNGDADALKMHLYPFRVLRDAIDGIMSAHIRLNVFDDEVTTFSHRAISDLLRGKNTLNEVNGNIEALGYSEKLIVTDDLSSMTSLSKYMKTMGKSYAELAKEAFSAGHDLLLFSHLITTPNERGRGKGETFTIDDLKSVLEALKQHVQASESAERQMRSSVRRLLIMKAKVIKQWGANVKELETGSWSPPPILREDFGKPQFLQKDGFTSGEKLLTKVFEQAYTTVHRNIDFNPSDVINANKAKLFVDEKSFAEFKRGLKEYELRLDIQLLPRDKRQILEQLKIDIEQALDSFDYVVITVLGIDDANLLHHGLLHIDKSNRPERQRRDWKKKLIGLLHTTPTVLSDDVLGQLTIVGNFSKNSRALKTDISLINQHLELKEKKNLPVHLGDNRIFFNAEKAEPFPISAESVTISHPIITSETLNYQEEISNQKEVIKIKQREIDELKKRMNNLSLRVEKFQSLLHFIGLLFTFFGAIIGIRTVLRAIFLVSLGELDGVKMLGIPLILIRTVREKNPEVFTWIAISSVGSAFGLCLLFDIGVLMIYDSAQKVVLSLLRINYSPPAIGPE